MTRRAFLSVIAVAPVLRAASWEGHAFPNWTPEIVDQLLTDSPWAHPVTVPFEFQPSANRTPAEFSFNQFQFPGSTSPPWGIPGGGWPGGRRTDPNTRIPVPSRPGSGTGYPSVRAEVYLTIRWSSALPIRRALALERWGQRGLETPDAVEFLNREEPDYVIEIFGLPASLASQGAKPLEKDLAKTARLVWKGQMLKPIGVEVPEYGEHLSAELRFKRSDAITPDQGIVEFRAETGPMKIATKFKLSAMTYEGRLEL
jgi:hypothetical protein